MFIVQTGVAIFGIIGNRAASYWRRIKPNSSPLTDIMMVSIPLLVMGIMQAFMASSTTLTQFCMYYFFGMVSLGWFYPAQSALLSSLTSKENRAIIFSGAGMLESITSALVCIYVSKHMNVTTLNKFWNLGSFALLGGLAVLSMSYFISTQNFVRSESKKIRQ